MARSGKLMRYAVACAASLVLICAEDISAQNKTQQTAPAPTYSAEDCTVGFYARDSVAIQMAGFKPWYDSVQRVQLRKQELQKEYFLATDRFLMATPDSGATVTPQQQSEYSAAKKETEMLNARIIAMTDQIYLLSTKYLDPYYDSIARTAVRISKQQRMSAVFELSENRPMTCPSDKMLMIDITNDIALAIGVKANRLRVGVYNTDSLLRLMPGYAKLADLTTAEMQSLNDSIAKLDAEIRKLQRELDSLREGLSGRKIREREKVIAEKQEHRDVHWNYESFKINDRDAERTHEYRLKLSNAALKAAQEQNCVKLDDEEAARAYWTEREAEFVDLNAVIAEKLR